MATKTQIGKLAVRRSIEINATPERVWQEFASEERMAFWFSDKGGVPMGNQHLTYEPRVGGIFQTEGMHEGVTPPLHGQGAGLRPTARVDRRDGHGPYGR